MARYFMGDTRLGWLERMMMEPPNPPRPNTAPKQKGRQKYRRTTGVSVPPPLVIDKGTKSFS